MIPTKRSSPFVRARSFQVNRARNGQDGTDVEGSPFKRPSFARTLSTPFQVLNPSLRNVRNPFEKLSLIPAAEDPQLGSTADHSLDSTKEDHLEDEALDTSQTLRMFSLSQPTLISVRKTKIAEESSDEDDDDEDPPDPEVSRHSLSENKDSFSPDYSKPRLYDILGLSDEQGVAHNRPELTTPEMFGGGSSKKSGSDYKTSSDIPLDWTLKTFVSITSPDTLMWCDQGTGGDEIAAVQNFISSKCSGNSASVPSNTARSRLLSSTYYWTYPSNNPTIPQAQSISKLLKSTGNMSTSEKNSISDLFSKSSEWKQAFRALYQACRNGACPYFYYMGTAWTVLFQHGSISLSGEPEAILTNSTPGLRKVLEDEDIKFESLPNVTGKTTIHNLSSKHDLDNLEENLEDNDFEPKQRPNPLKTPLLPSENQNLSDALLFKGPLDVHGLFSYLLNMKTSYEDGFLYQSPSLIANVPFLHAALKRAQIIKCRVVSKPIEGTDRMQREFRIDIDGTLLPTSVKELCSVFADQQQATGYSCTATSDARSFGLNLRPLGSNEKGSSNEHTFVSAKDLNQLRYDGNLQQFTWLAQQG
ncbi:hypothetical protein BGZ65_003922 [Modicella reniformis]|uniref:Uncharacterized protein n=1 Tax=Modicella reniformis TaxID=1440133 RepID=A0A9P6LSV1_9FUNG|nr:hypothetical protein BGZ65_003922 [Modicella reniformis]